MKCWACTFELPGDWPPTKIKMSDTEDPPLEITICAPCLRRLEGAGRDRGDVMTGPVLTCDGCEQTRTLYPTDDGRALLCADCTRLVKAV